MSDLPLHRTMQDDEIDRLKAQLKEAEEKGRVLMDMCRDLKARVAELERCVDDGSDAWLLRKQAEAVERAAMNFGGRDYSEVRLGLCEWAKHLRQQADEAERAGGES